MNLKKTKLSKKVAEQKKVSYKMCRNYFENLNVFLRCEKKPWAQQRKQVFDT